MVERKKVRRFVDKRRKTLVQRDLDLRGESMGFVSACFMGRHLHLKIQEVE